MPVRVVVPARRQDDVVAGVAAVLAFRLAEVRKPVRPAEVDVKAPAGLHRGQHPGHVLVTAGPTLVWRFAVEVAADQAARRLAQDDGDPGDVWPGEQPGQ